MFTVIKYKAPDKRAEIAEIAIALINKRWLMESNKVESSA